MQITPEPSREEREAIIRALEVELEGEGGPSRWQKAALSGSDAATPEPGRGPRVVEP